MELNFKARAFIAQALRREIQWHEEQLRRTDLSEDERSDLTNDMYYLRSLLEGIRPDQKPA